MGLGARTSGAIAEWLSKGEEFGAAEPGGEAYGPLAAALLREHRVGFHRRRLCGPYAVDVRQRSVSGEPPLSCEAFVALAFCLSEVVLAQPTVAASLEWARLVCLQYGVDRDGAGQGALRRRLGCG